MSKTGPPPDSEDAGNSETQSVPSVQPTQQPRYIATSQLQPETVYHHQIGGNQATITVAPIQAAEKSIVDAYVLGITLGLIGAHHLYLRRPWFFVAYFFTFGLLGVGYLIDICRMPCLVKEANARIRDASREDKKSKVDAYILWFPFGLLGFHLFYLKRPAQGLLYLFTFGLCGIGFLVDLFRIPYMVKDCNKKEQVYQEKSMFAACVLCYSPLGILGLHHYYLNRPFWGLLYTFTFGLLGVGWIVDWCRCYALVIRTREEEQGQRDKGVKYNDDIYLLWFPLGIAGLHHFYLQRYAWGFLYFFTFGLFGIGWLIDFCRLPCMVKEYNKILAENRALVTKAQQTIPGVVNARITGSSLVTTSIVGQQTTNYGATVPHVYGGSTTIPQPQGLTYIQQPQGAAFIPQPHGSATAPPPQGAAFIPQPQGAATIPPPQGAAVGVYGYGYPQYYPNVNYVQQYPPGFQVPPGYQQQQFQQPQPGAPPMQAAAYKPPTYEEATHETTQAKKG